MRAVTTREKVAVLMARGLDATEIGKRLKINRVSARYHMRKIAAIVDGRERSGGHNRDEERAAEIACRNQEGETLTSIAEEMGISVSAASHMLKRHGFK